jgi:hypothetical protein
VFFLRMRRSIPILVGLALLAAPGASAAAPSYVKLLDCSRGHDSQNRGALFRGVMRSVPGTGRMAMRFTLQERSGGGPWRVLKAPGLGVWRRSRAGVRRFAHRQRVVALPAGSTYRVVVSYRWYSGDGDLIRRAKRRSGTCRQPGTLPDLRVARIGASPLEGSPGLVRYVVHVRNRGGAPAVRFGVRLAVDGDVVDTRPVERLSPGALARVAFVGPACRVGVEGLADANDTVREGDERDNALSGPCPALP